MSPRSKFATYGYLGKSFSHTTSVLSVLENGNSLIGI